MAETLSEWTFPPARLDTKHLPELSPLSTSQISTRHTSIDKNIPSFGLSSFIYLLPVAGYESQHEKNAH